jgi:protoporphyrinogen IX oxidase
MDWAVMDLFFNFLLVVHLAALGLGISTTFVAPIIGSRMPKAPPEARSTLLGILGRLTLNARVAMGLLLVTGIAMVFVRYNGDFANMGPWFLVKMGLVVLILVLMIAAAVLKPGTLNPQLMGWLTRLAMAGIVIAAVMAFN